MRERLSDFSSAPLIDFCFAKLDYFPDTLSLGVVFFKIKSVSMS